MIDGIIWIFFVVSVTGLVLVIGEIIVRFIEGQYSFPFSKSKKPMAVYRRGKK